MTGYKARPVPLDSLSLSVIIPCYNEIQTIEQILAIVLEQSVVKEVVIVDDGSTDGTRDILKRLQTEMADQPVRIVFHEHNRGKGAALVTGFQHASGDVLVIQDADLAEKYDLFLERSLES